MWLSESLVAKMMKFQRLSMYPKTFANMPHPIAIALALCGRTSTEVIYPFSSHFVQLFSFPRVILMIEEHNIKLFLNLQQLALTYLKTPKF